MIWFCLRPFNRSKDFVRGISCNNTSWSVFIWHRHTFHNILLISIMQCNLCLIFLTTIFYHYSLRYTTGNHHFIEVIKIFLTSLVNTRCFKKNVMMDSPLHTAVAMEYLEAIDLMLHSGASITQMNRAGLTPLHLCIDKKLKRLLEVSIYERLLANYIYIPNFGTLIRLRKKYAMEL